MLADAFDWAKKSIFGNFAPETPQERLTRQLLEREDALGPKEAAKDPLCKNLERQLIVLERNGPK